MAMTTVSIKVLEDMAKYTVSGNEKTDLVRNAMILYPPPFFYIQNDTMFHGKTAEILGIHYVL